MSAYEGEFDIFAHLEAETLLSKTREGIIRLAYTRLDDAMMREAEESENGSVYYWHEDTEGDEPTIMLTRDGVYPYSEEINDKEQIIIHFTGSDLNKVRFEHVKDGDRYEFELETEDLRVLVDDDISNHYAAEQEVEPTADDIALLEQPSAPISEMSRLSSLREKIRRFELTKRA